MKARFDTQKENIQFLLGRRAIDYEFIVDKIINTQSTLFRGKPMFKPILGLDDLDNQILGTLKYNARLSYTEIAKECGVTRVSVKNRMNALEEKGIIKGYHTIIDDSETETGIKFYVTMEVMPEKYEEVRTRLEENPIIREISIATGRCRLFAMGVSPDSRSLRVFVGELYDHLDGISNIEVTTVLTTLKEDTGEDNGKGDKS